MPTEPKQSRDYRDEPTYWFAVLEIAKERSDFERAVAAQRELKRLGITVRYQRYPRGEATRV